MAQKQVGLVFWVGTKGEKGETQKTKFGVSLEGLKKLHFGKMKSDPLMPQANYSVLHQVESTGQLGDSNKDKDKKKTLYRARGQRGCA